ncbi:MAG: hypothetical protein V4737_16330, partial [Curtobacterium sp.]
AKHGTPDHIGALHRNAPDGTTVVDRGAIFYYTDIDSRFAPVEICLPPDFLKRAGTKPSEIRARKAAEAQARRAAGSVASVTGPVLPTAIDASATQAPQRR